MLKRSPVPKLPKLRRCKTCRVRKPLDDFSKTASGAPTRRCKECIDNPRRRHNPEQVERTLYDKRVKRNRRRIEEWRRRNSDEWEAHQTRALEAEQRRGYPTAAKRRALLYDAFVEEINKRVLYQLCEGCCGLCGGPIAYADATIDHIIPLSRGGLHSYDNVQIAHGRCNRRKSNNLPEDHAA